MVSSPQRAQRSIAWSHGVAAIDALGAMIGPATFTLDDGRQISPFHVAPWWNEIQAVELPGILRRLRGEWPCVPFGYPVPKGGFPAEWQAVMDDDEELADVHGYSSNHQWTFKDDGAMDTLSLFIDYPANSPVRRLERTILPVDGHPAIDFELRIEVREDCALPLGIHACFRLPERPGSVRLYPGAFAHGLTYPGTVEPSAPLFAAGRRFSSLHAVPTRVGGEQDATWLPFDRPAEELLQLNGSDGHFALANIAEAYRVTFDWDAAAFPSVLLWYSNRGRPMAPWNSRHLAVGIEPICSPFGLSPKTALANNPIARSGVPTTHALWRAAPAILSYRIGIEPL
jgi:hypothetical protein